MGSMGNNERKVKPMYEYVPKTEYAPVRKELEEIIRKAQVFLRQKYKITFQYHLIGSGKRHLIMRDTSGNKGYDFDYNMILPYKPEQKPKQLNEYFRLAFNFAVKGTAYKCPEDSTTVLTIKVVDPKHKKIAHSCDFAIIYYPYKNTDDGYFYLKNWKDGRYTFEFRQLSEGAERKLAELKEYSDWWPRIKDEYKKLKNNNKQKKRSFVLYLESINNVYNHIKQENERDNNSNNGFIVLNPFFR